MTIEKTKKTYFGDKNTFAISYIPGYKYHSDGMDHYYANCHLVLGGQLIGHPKEPCYLGSWLYSLKLIIDKIKNDFSSFSHLEFLNKSDREIFELIWKANRKEDSYKAEYAYLPTLDNKVWSNCSLDIDETIDAYLMTMTEDNGKIKFMWEAWRAPCPKSKIGKLFSITVDRFFVIETLETCIAQIESEYLNYPIET